MKAKRRMKAVVCHRGGRSVGILVVPSGRALCKRVAEISLAGRLTPNIDGVLPLTGVPEALSAIGHGAVKGKIVIRPGA